jgi:hypothetical protein
MLRSQCLCHYTQIMEPPPRDPSHRAARRPRSAVCGDGTVRSGDVVRSIRIEFVAELSRSVNPTHVETRRCSKLAGVQPVGRRIGMDAQPTITLHCILCVSVPRNAMIVPRKTISAPRLASFTGSRTQSYANPSPIEAHTTMRRKNIYELSRLFNWREARVAVQTDTLIRWHRKTFRLFSSWKSKPTGRPRLPKNLQKLIRRMSLRTRAGDKSVSRNELMLTRNPGLAADRAEVPEHGKPKPPPVIVTSVSEPVISLASPKSSSLATPFPVTRMFPGLRSR